MGLKGTLYENLYFYCVTVEKYNDETWMWDQVEKTSFSDLIEAVQCIDAMKREMKEPSVITLFRMEPEIVEEWQTKGEE